MVPHTRQITDRSLIPTVRGLDLAGQIYSRSVYDLYDPPHVVAEWEPWKPCIITLDLALVFWIGSVLYGFWTTYYHENKKMF